MNPIAVPATAVRRVLGALCGVGMAGAVVLGSGCSSYSSQAMRVDRANRTEVVRVAPSLAGPVAEREAAAHEGDFTLVGAGESMAPVYPAGTVVVVHPTSYFMLRPGMAVVYVNHRGHHVAHVLIEESEAGWTAQGVNNAQADDEVVTCTNLVGVVRVAFVPDPTRLAVPASAPLVMNSGSVDGIALLH